MRKGLQKCAPFLLNLPTIFPRQKQKTLKALRRQGFVACLVARRERIKPQWNFIVGLLQIHPTAVNSALQLSTLNFQ